MTGRKIRVLVVDDSAFARKVLREVLSTNPRLEVVGIARDGLEALEQIQELRPDVVTLDLMMPNLDGVGLLRALAPLPPPGPRVVIVSTSAAESELAVQALEAGAFDLVHKPTALATHRLYELGTELVAKVLAAGALEPRWTAPAKPTPAPVLPARGDGAQVVVLGTSTGGPQALTRLFRDLPADLPAPLIIALHIPAGYTQALARRLNQLSAMNVCEAEAEMPLQPGTALLAPGGHHLELVRVADRLVAQVHPDTGSSLYAPSVDRLFTSAATAAGAGVLGVVLTGMGDDGLRGARDIRQAGGRVVTEAESSCVVYGMPRAVHEAGLSQAQAPLEQMATLIRTALLAPAAVGG